jgi:hypothetical protein
MTHGGTEDTSAILEAIREVFMPLARYRPKTALAARLSI